MKSMRTRALLSVISLTAAAAALGTTLAAVEDRPTLASLVGPPTKEPPLSDERLPVHTLLREDLFAGFLANDMKRLERGEKNLERLLELRPTQKGNLLAWKAGVMGYRAVLAHEAKREDEYNALYKKTKALLAEAAAQKSGNDGVAPITGGMYVIFADRLPEPDRAAAWQTAYESYAAIWKQQQSIVDVLPVHLKGELLAGMAVSAQRTGRTEELGKTLERMGKLLKGTAYEATVKKWQADPKAANPSLACMTCHDGGRLDARIAELEKK